MGQLAGFVPYVCLCVDLQHFFCKPKNILESETDHSKDTRSCTILNLTC